MCGICGVVTTDRRDRPAAQRMEAASALLQRRGPDDSGIYLSPEGPDPHAALGHRRLSIIDLSGGRQPMSNEDGTVWITFNGEIYNFQELRRDLEAAGHHFRTHSDTEAIIHGYEAYGEKCVSRLRGMFAFALWDDRHKRLLLARDRLGQKPLFYARKEGLLAFASHPAALFALWPFERRLSPQALDAYLAYQYVPHPLSIYEGVEKLSPAQYLVYENRQVRLESYWHIDVRRRAKMSEDEACERVRAALRESVKLRLISDVPLGAFLSGGIDSTIIVGLMAEEMGRPVETFTIGFDEADYSELEYARAAARKFGTSHHELVLKPKAAEILPGLAEYFGEPFGDSSAIPTYYVSRFTREKVKVALTGDAGDENFAGYARYKAVKLGQMLDHLPALIRRGFDWGLWQKWPGGGHSRAPIRRLQRFLAGLRLPPCRRYYHWMSIFTDDGREGLYTEAFRKRVAVQQNFDFIDRYFAQAQGIDGVAATMYVDLCTYLPDDLLVKVDVTSMANSLEARSPFLDHPFVELAASLPIEFKLRRLKDKYLLKRAFADLLPEVILRRGKMGFGVPIAHWLRGELKEFARQTLLEGYGIRSGIFRPEAVRGLLDLHLGGERDTSAQLWSLLMFELWAAGQPSPAAW